ncbi:MAG: hypothetical protein MJ053_07015 [Elusimicrobiaceae bacterium]|nr:hypothetical protein [Elusimicrobiaceae bacterium]
MWLVGGVILGCCLLWTVVFLARENGRKTERLHQLKESARQAARVQHAIDTVEHLAVADVQRLLRKQR